jgi:hypothetical protein
LNLFLVTVHIRKTSHHRLKEYDAQEDSRNLEEAHIMKLNFVSVRTIKG